MQSIVEHIGNCEHCGDGPMTTEDWSALCGVCGGAMCVTCTHECGGGGRGIEGCVVDAHRECLVEFGRTDGGRQILWCRKCLEIDAARLRSEADERMREAYRAEDALRADAGKRSRKEKAA